jgi:hypothetical protein
VNGSPDLTAVESSFDPVRMLFFASIMPATAMLIMLPLLGEADGLRTYLELNLFVLAFSVLVGVPIGAFVAWGNRFNISMRDEQLNISSWWGKKNTATVPVAEARWWIDKRGRISIRYCSYLKFIRSLGIWPYRVLLRPKPEILAVWVRCLKAGCLPVRPIPGPYADSPDVS